MNYPLLPQLGRSAIIRQRSNLQTASLVGLLLTILLGGQKVFEPVLF